MVSNKCDSIVQYKNDSSFQEFQHLVVMFSGDGIIFEVVNGLSDMVNVMSVEEKKNIFQRICLAPIPCGSGNAIAQNLKQFSYSLLNSDYLNSAFIATMGHTKLLDAMKITFLSDKVSIEDKQVYSLLSLV